MTAIAIRPERGGDAPAIFALTEAALLERLIVAAFPDIEVPADQAVMAQTPLFET